MPTRTEATILPFTRPSRLESTASEVDDLRFRALLGEAAWAQPPEFDQGPLRQAGGRLPHRALCRGSRRMPDDNRRMAARAGRSADRGAAADRRSDCEVPACVSVTEDEAFGGQFWTRVYGHKRGFPQVIHSSKRFAGPTGLEEYVGWGFGIALRCEVTNAALHFISDHYFHSLFGLRLRIPPWLEPGELRVSHIDCNHGWFAFQLLASPRTARRTRPADGHVPRC